MNIRDRVKQSATNDGVTPTTFDLSAGSVPEGYVGFADAYDTSDLLSGSKTLTGVPLLVEKADGAWQVLIGVVTFTWTGPGAGEGTWSFSGTFYSSSTGAVLSFAAAEVVTVSVATAAFLLSSLALRPIVPPATTDEHFDGSHFPRLASDALAAIGTGAYASANGAVAIGDGAIASQEHAIALGAGVFAGMPHALVAGAPGAFASSPVVHTVGFGQSPGFGSGMMTQYLTFDRGIRNALTVDATPGKLIVDIAGFGGFPNSGDIYCDAGLTIIEGEVVAIAMNGDMKVWHVKVMVRTELDWSASAVVGVPVKDELYATAGAASWDLTNIVNSATNMFSLQATGEAAKNIAWSFAYTAKFNTVYI